MVMNSSVECGGACLQVPIQLGTALFLVDLLLLPVFGTNVVLGVHWLAKLGPIVFDYQQLWIEFDYQGARVRLHGMKTQSSSTKSPVALKHHVRGQAENQYFHLSVSWTSIRRPHLFLLAFILTLPLLLTLLTS